MKKAMAMSSFSHSPSPSCRRGVGTPVCLFRLVALFLALTGAAGGAGFPVTLADGLGGTITLTRRPARIVSLAPNVTEILFAIGAGDRVVGVTRYCNYPPEAKRIPKVGGYTDISVEAVVALKPDLVVANRGNPKTTLDALKRRGLVVIAIGPESVGEVQRAILRIGEATGERRGAERVCREMGRALDSVRKALAGLKRRRRVYFGSLAAPYFTAGPSSFVGHCIELAGGDNIARGAREPWPLLSLETIVERDPEVVFAAFQGGLGRGEKARRRLIERLRADRVWSKTTAVRTGRVYIMNDDAVQRPGPRLARVVERMARLLYPERFGPDERKKPR